MEVMIHMGLARTGSTYLQALCTLNRAPLAEAGLSYAVDDGRSSICFSAWAAQLGQFEPLIQHVRRARAGGFQRILLSSEDFANMTIRREQSADLLHCLLNAGATRLRIVCFVRRQGEMFWGIYSTMSRSMYIDPHFMFFEVMRRGMYIIHDARHDLSIAPYYCFPFYFGNILLDYFFHLQNIVKDLEIDAYNYDYNAAFPSERLFQNLGLQDRFTVFPDETLWNKRLSSDEISIAHARNYARVLEPELGERMQLLTEARAVVAPQLKEEMSAALRNRYEAGTKRLLDMYGAS